MGGGEMIRRVPLEGIDCNTLPHKFEAGTPAIAEAAGLGAAIDYLNGLGMENILAHEQSVVDYALERLSEVPGLTLSGPPPDRGNGVATFARAAVHAQDIAQLRHAEGVAIRAGHHGAMPLHQWLGVAATARASFYLYNTRADVDALIHALERVRSVFRS